MKKIETMEQMADATSKLAGLMDHVMKKTFEKLEEDLGIKVAFGVWSVMAISATPSHKLAAGVGEEEHLCRSQPTAVYYLHEKTAESFTAVLEPKLRILTAGVNKGLTTVIKGRWADTAHDLIEKLETGKIE